MYTIRDAKDYEYPDFRKENSYAYPAGNPAFPNILYS